jgi:DNA gyrase subunit A
VGAVVVRDDEEILAITSSGSVIRTRAGEVRQTGRDTMGVRLVNLKDGDLVVTVARNAESDEILALEESPSLGEATDSV